MQNRIRRKPGICRFTDMERDFISLLVGAALSWCQRVSMCWCMEIILRNSIFVPQQSLKLFWNYTEKLYMINTK